MKAGRELDALVAEKVFEYRTYKTSNPFDYTGKDKNIYLMSQLDKEGHVEETKHYSTDIAAAWEVVDKLVKKDRPHFQMGLCDTYTDNPKWYAEFDLDRPMKRVVMIGETAPLLICLAALKALGVEV